jgi:hypothetical protein
MKRPARGVARSVAASGSGLSAEKLPPAEIIEAASNGRFCRGKILAQKSWFFTLPETVISACFSGSANFSRTSSMLPRAGGFAQCG